MKKHLSLLTAAILAMGLAMRNLLSRRLPIRRAAFDIGSGGTKMLVAEVDPDSGALLASLWEADTPVPFKADQQANGGQLSDDIQARGIDVLRSMMAKARALGATEAAGIATEVFRTATNGEQFLVLVRVVLGLDVSVVTQALEARLGLATAEALGAARGAVWDSGGGSFQITERAPSAHAPVRSAELRTYTGRLGTSPAFEALVTGVLRRPYKVDASPNPVSLLCRRRKQAPSIPRHSFGRLRDTLEEVGAFHTSQLPRSYFSL